MQMEKTKIREIENQFVRVMTISFEGFSKLSNILKEEVARTLFCVYIGFLFHHTVFTNNDILYQDEFYAYYINIAKYSLCSYPTVKRRAKLLKDLSLIEKVREEKCSNSHKKKIYYRIVKPSPEAFELAYRKAVTLLNKPIFNKINAKNLKKIKKNKIDNNEIIPQDIKRGRD